MPILSSRTAVSRSVTLAILAAALITVAGSVRAQSKVEYRTSLSVGAINYENRSDATANLYGSYSFGTTSLSATNEATYSFGEGTGTSLGAADDTIRLNGTGFASAVGLGFNDLKAGVTATLENAYLNLDDIENAPTEGNGMKAPYVWIANAAAGWTLSTRFEPAYAVNNRYTVKWVFAVDGVQNSNNGGYGFAYLGFSTPLASYSFSTTSLAPTLWATGSIPVLWGQTSETNADLNANWQYNLFQEANPVYGEGGEQIGYVAPSQLDAVVDYASTVKLDEIQVFDENGNRFYDFTVDDGSGNVYYNGRADAGAVAAPEPGTLALISLGLLTFPVCRRCRRATS